MTNKGILYIAVNSHNHFNEAIESAKSVLSHNNINITIITDQDYRPLDNLQYKQVHPVVHHPLKDKCRLMSESPYDKTLFLDTDTKILGDISPIFDYLEEHDIVVANAPDVDRSKDRLSKDFLIDYKIPNIYNTGVLGFRNNDKINKFFNMWWDRFKEIPNSKVNTGHGDQIYFNKLLNDKDVDTSFLNIKVVDNKKYNARGAIMPFLIEDDLDRDIIIYHGHRDINDFYGQKVK